MSERGATHLLALVLVVTGLGLVTTGSVWWSLAPPGGAPAARRVLAVPPVAVVPGEVFVPAAPLAPPGPVVVPAAPVRVVVPALGVDAPVVPVHAVGGTLVPPSDPFELGWWADGPRPGAARGVALITGHTVHNGPAPFDSLGRLRPGDLVEVRTKTALLAYRVTQVRTYSQGALARQSEQIFDPTGPGRLALVTCSDWDGHRYLSNVVVTGALA